MTIDAPMDDLAWEQEVFDGAKILERDQVRLARRTRFYTTAARHDPTGRIVGFTCLVVDDGRDEHASQWETIVLPDHRGHRLGLLLKIANLRHLRGHEPAVTTIDTWNADSNGPMLRVNLALGFQVVRQWAEWELVLLAARPLDRNDRQNPSLRSWRGSRCQSFATVTCRCR